jgi:phage gp36-like protein
MSRYIDWQDVANRYADSAKSGGGAEEMKLSFINDAEDEVDARLANRYTVPFTPVPGVIAGLCIDLTYYKMKIGTKGVEPLKKYIDQRFTDLNDGTMTLTLSGTALGSSDRAWSTTQDFPSSFGVDPAERWTVSSAWQQDFDDRRC